MKQLFILLSISFLMILGSGCSTSLSEIPKNKIDYVKSAVICDAKTGDFKILNPFELAEFLDRDDIGRISVKYESKNKKREVKITRVSINEVIYYMASFDQYTFPFSECNDIKNKTRNFE